MARAVRERWTPEMELLAALLELTHANYRVLCQIGGAKRSDLPEPLKVPRPGDETSTKTKKVAASPTEFAQWIKTRNEETGG